MSAPLGPPRAARLRSQSAAALNDTDGTDRTDDTASTASIARRSGVMAVGTLASRATGFIRTAVIVAVLGSHQLAEAYNIPNTAPNAVYDLLLGGILTSVVVPLLVKAVHEDAHAGEAYAQRLLTFVAVVLGVCTVGVVLAAPLVVDVYAHGFTGAQRTTAITFARYFLPQIFFYGLSATIGAILNTRGRFAAPMWTPVLNNLVVITTGVLFLVDTSGRATVPLSAGQTELLGIGTTAGVVLQTLALWPSLRGSGFRWRPRFDWRSGSAGSAAGSAARSAGSGGLGQAARLGGWVLVYVLVNQLGLVVVTNLGGSASRAATSHHIAHGDSFSAYSYAYQLFQLPYAIVAVSVITALLPRISAHAVAGRLAQMRGDLSGGLRMAGTAIVPATAALIALAPQITAVAFGHRNTSPADARYIAWLLVVFAIGLVPFSIFQLLLRAFYAMHDTRTPAFINVVATAINIGADIVLYLALPPGSRAIGLAAGFSLSYWAALALTARAVGRRLHGLDGVRVVRTYVRLTVASAIAGGIAFGLARLATAVLGHDFAASVVALVAGAGIGGSVLVSLAAHMRITEATELIDLVRRRLGGGGVRA